MSVINKLRTRRPDLVAAIEGLSEEELEKRLLASEDEEKEEKKAEAEQDEEADAEEEEEEETEAEAEEEEDKPKAKASSGRAPKLAARGGTRGEKPASIDQLKSAFPKTKDRAFCMECLEEGLTMAEAYKLRADRLEQQVDALKTKKEAAQASESTDPARAGGARAAGDTVALDALAAEIKAECAKNGEIITDMQALSRAAQRDPEAHKAWLARHRAA